MRCSEPHSIGPKIGLDFRKARRVDAKGEASFVSAIGRAPLWSDFQLRSRPTTTTAITRLNRKTAKRGALASSALPSHLGQLDVSWPGSSCCRSSNPGCWWCRPGSWCCWCHRSAFGSWCRSCCLNRVSSCRALWLCQNRTYQRLSHRLTYRQSRHRYRYPSQCRPNWSRRPHRPCPNLRCRQIRYQHPAPSPKMQNSKRRPLP